MRTQIIRLTKHISLKQTTKRSVFGLNAVADHFRKSLRSTPSNSISKSHYICCSEVVEIVSEGVTRQGVTIHQDVVGVICNLVRVHHSSWNLDCADEVEEIIAQVVGELLNLLLGHVGSVCDYKVVNRKSSSDSCFMSDHVEVKACLIAGMLNQTLINNSAGSWVLIFVMALLGKSCVDSFVN